MMLYNAMKNLKTGRKQKTQIIESIQYPFITLI